MVKTVLFSNLKVIISDEEDTGNVGLLSGVVESYPTVKSRIPTTLCPATVGGYENYT